MTEQKVIKYLVVQTVLLSVVVLFGLSIAGVFKSPDLSGSSGLEIPDYCHPSHVVESSIVVDEWKLYSERDGWLLVTKGTIDEASLTHLDAFPFELAKLRLVPRGWRDSLTRAFERQDPEIFSEVLVEPAGGDPRARCVVITSLPREVGDKMIAESARE